jgi:tetratricopeptide (TPR) repeat protein
MSVDLAVLFALDGRPAEARPLMEDALRVREAQVGPEHIALAQTLYNLGCVLLDLGEPADAHAHITRALAIHEKAIGPDSLEGARYLSELGRAELDLERPAVARPLLERALELRERHEVAPGEIAETRFQLARALWSTPAERTRATELGRQAEAVLRGVPHLKQPHAAAVAWLAERGIPVLPNDPPAESG